jgi:hypothetical protein
MPAARDGRRSPVIRFRISRNRSRGTGDLGHLERDMAAQRDEPIPVFMSAVAGQSSLADPAGACEAE